ncbi:unnamed protein product [Meganyctiphanes norvegica]|uniref:Uncharacterized protein n=1 Tax=Meganyctiphanes norvegica TaxID=48144 RepID=A0AAV2RRQ5_MEGNR
MEVTMLFGMYMLAAGLTTFKVVNCVYLNNCDEVGSQQTDDGSLMSHQEISGAFLWTSENDSKLEIFDIERTRIKQSSCVTRTKCSKAGGECQTSRCRGGDVIQGGCRGEGCICCVQNDECVIKKKCTRRGGECVRRPRDCDGRIVEGGCKRTKGSPCTCCVQETTTTEEPTEPPTTEIPTTLEPVTDNPKCSLLRECPLQGGYCIERHEPCDGKLDGKSCRGGPGVRCVCCIPQF